MSLIHSPRIVTSDIIMHYDVSNIKSYPGSGTCINNLGSTICTMNGYNVENSFTNSSPSYFSFDGSVKRFKTTSEPYSFANTYDFTIEAWINPDNVSGNKAAVARRSLKDDFLGLSGSSIYISRYQTGGISGGTVSAGQWCQIVGAGTSLKLYIYKDGSPITSGDHTTAFSGTFLNWYIGCLHDAYAEVSTGFVGKIANVKVYNRKLTDNEILQNYNALKKRFGL